ncbi:MAG: hypothetical protein JXM69_14255 [Anaerolineae bacterium]|nr:hypothetical protein [Anaerolineae bacterium]
MWLACHTQEEIAAEVGVSQQAIAIEIEEIQKNAELPKLVKVQFLDDFEIPIYNVWTFAKNTNGVKHPGNSEQRTIANKIKDLEKKFPGTKMLNLAKFAPQTRHNRLCAFYFAFSSVQQPQTC